MLTGERLVAIEAACARAEALSAATSPGPWSHGLDMDPPDTGIEAAGGGCVAHVQCHGNVNTVARTGQEFSHDDARFVAESRALVPALAAHCRDLLAAVRELEMAADPACVDEARWLDCVNEGAASMATQLLNDNGRGVMSPGPCADAQAAWRELKRRRAELEAENAKLRAALKPFADHYAERVAELPTLGAPPAGYEAVAADAAVVVRLGECRAAADLLAAHEPAGGP